MDEVKQEKLPIDARLLAEAVIELNISRRSVSLYPPEHPFIKESIQKAYGHLQKLFELRSAITLGIAENSLIIDEYALDKKNPVFQEFALSLSGKSIAAITFSAGLSPEELVLFHELITMREGPMGAALHEFALMRGLKHIRVEPINLASLNFTEGSLKQGSSGRTLWEDYVYGLLEGKLSIEDAEGMLLNVQPQQVASLINDLMVEDLSNESYERVITSYLRGSEKHGARKECLQMFGAFITNLKPSLKVEFLKRAVSLDPSEIGEMEHLFAGLEVGDLRKIIEVFKDRDLTIPESLSNLIDKLGTLKRGKGFLFDVTLDEKAVVDDIEIDEKILSLMDEDKFRTFVGTEYRRDLKAMLKGVETEEVAVAEAIREEIGEGVVDRFFSEVVFELLEIPYVSRDDYLNLLTKLSQTAEAFLRTGRFGDLCDVHNAVYTDTLTGRFKDEASSMIQYFFRSPAFASSLMDAFKQWGRYDREGALRLARLLRLEIVIPVLDALAEELDPSKRKFFLQLLTYMGSDILVEVIKRLNDSRWFVIRNMLYLIRERGGEEHVNYVRMFVKNKNKKVSMEALKALLHFNTPDALAYLKLFVSAEDPDLRQQAVMLCGTYKITEAVPNLVGILEERDMLGGKSHSKVMVVRALSQIGDSRAIEPLIRLYRSRTLFFPKALNDLKVEIFRNLDGYAPKAIKPLIDMGLKSRTEEIRVLSENFRLVKAETIEQGKEDV
ncbi:MAG: HEAT repeat domain-containing protein [Thermodesulfovibrionales bacterium]